MQWRYLKYHELEGTHEDHCPTPNSTQGNLKIKPYLSEHFSLDTNRQAVVSDKLVPVPGHHLNEEPFQSEVLGHYLNEEPFQSEEPIPSLNF